MLRLALLGVLCLTAPLSAQDGLSPVTMDHVDLGADYDGRRDLCRILVKATARNPQARVAGCQRDAVELVAGDEPADARLCRFIALRAGTVLYLDDAVKIHKGARPTPTADIQTRLERHGIISVGGLLQSFGFTAVTAGDATVELHYNNCKQP